VELNEFVIDSGSAKRLVWFTYWADGTITNNPLLVRLLQAKGALSGHEGQAVIAVSTPLDVPVDDARTRLSKALSFLGPLSTALPSAATGPTKDPRAG
jgi:hypothetical protein